MIRSDATIAVRQRSARIFPGRSLRPVLRNKGVLIALTLVLLPVALIYVFCRLLLFAEEKLSAYLGN